MFVVDQWILDPMERFGKWVQRMTGAPPIRLALVGDVLFGSALLSSWIVPGFVLGQKIWYTICALGIFTMTVFHYPTLEATINRFAAKGMSNPHKIDPLYTFLRLMFLCMLSVMTFDLFTFREEFSKHLCFFFIFLGGTLGLYFLACDPLPPGESRLRQWINSFFRSVQRSN